MKATLFFVLTLFTFSPTIAQQIKNNTINRADNVEILDGVVTIMKADSVIIKIFVIDKKTFIYLDSINHSYDTVSKLYITKYYLANHPLSLKTEFEFMFKFNSQVTSFRASSNGSGSTNVQTIQSENNTFYATGHVVSSKGVLVRVESKEKVHASIRGIDGAFKD